MLCHSRLLGGGGEKEGPWASRGRGGGAEGVAWGPVGPSIPRRCVRREEGGRPGFYGLIWFWVGRRALAAGGITS